MNTDNVPHTPLRITAHLQCGVISDRFLPLDGVLFYVQMRERFGELLVTAPGECLRRGGHATPPFRRIRPARDVSYFACSFARWEGTVAEGLDAWNKRADWTAADLVDFGGRRGRIDTAAGRYKSYHADVYYRHARAVRWYAMGRKAEIERLLRFVFWLGKKREMGWGAVLRWEVEDWHADWSVRDAGGRLMRALPDPRGPDFYGLRPPYWSRAHQRPCVLPDEDREKTKPQENFSAPVGAPRKDARSACSLSDGKRLFYHRRGDNAKRNNPAERQP